MSFCHHFASVVCLSVNILHFDLLKNHWTEFNFIFKSNGNQLPRWAIQAPWSTFFALEPLVCFGIKVLGIGLSATKCNVLHRCLEFYKSCLQVQFKSLHIDFLPFCIAKLFFSECAICMDVCADTVLYKCGHNYGLLF